MVKLLDNIIVLMELLNKIVEKIEKTITRKTKTAKKCLIVLLKFFSEFTKIGFKQNEIEIIDTAIAKINKNKLFQRDLKLTEEAIKLSTQIFETLQKVQKIRNGVLFKTEWGNASYSNGKLRLSSSDDNSNNQLQTKITLLPELINQNDLSLDFEVNIKKDGILNVLFVTSELTNSELTDEYYMARLETRTSSHVGIRDGFLFKPQNSNWNLIDPDLPNIKTSPERWVRVKITIANRLITLLKRKGKEYSTIESISIDNPIRYIGFGNELKDVLLRNIKIDFISK